MGVRAAWKELTLHKSFAATFANARAVVSSLDLATQVTPGYDVQNPAISHALAQ